MQKNKGDGPVGTVQVLSKMKNSEEASRLIKMAVDAGKDSFPHICCILLHVVTRVVGVQ